jgi:hypothetical protein
MYERELTHHLIYEFALSQSVFWSKNVMEERYCRIRRSYLAAWIPTGVLLAFRRRTLLGAELGTVNTPAISMPKPTPEADSKKLVIATLGRWRICVARVCGDVLAVERTARCTVFGSTTLLGGRGRTAARWTVGIRGRWKAAGNRRVVMHLHRSEQRYIDSKVCAFIVSTVI